MACHGLVTTSKCVFGTRCDRRRTLVCLWGSEMLRSLMANGAPLIVALGLCSMFGMAEHAEAAVWAWTYSGEGFAASGTVTASDTPDAGGFVPITAISGNRNGVLIVGLQPTGTAIPGNDGFPVDNLVTAATPHLTSKGIGYQL